MGSCHVPPNGAGEYDYDNPRAVQSDAADWLHYPRLTGHRARAGVARELGRSEPPPQLLAVVVRAPPARGGVNRDGRQNNWWAYVFRFDSLLVEAS